MFSEHLEDAGRAGYGPVLRHGIELARGKDRSNR